MALRLSCLVKNISVVMGCTDHTTNNPWCPPVNVSHMQFMHHNNNTLHHTQLQIHITNNITKSSQSVDIVSHMTHITPHMNNTSSFHRRLSTNTSLFGMNERIKNDRMWLEAADYLTRKKHDMRQGLVDLFYHEREGDCYEGVNSTRSRCSVYDTCHISE